jgi:hypothetical protein
MNVTRIKRPSPAFVVATIALFVGLGGTAGAVATQGVPLAKRALVAENAKKLGGQTSAQITAKAAQQASRAPGPASTAAGLVVTKTQSAGQVPAGDALATFDISCDSGRVIGGGMSSDGAIVTFDSFPKSDTTWEVIVGNFGDSTASVASYVLCLR